MQSELKNIILWLKNNRVISYNLLKSREDFKEEDEIWLELDLIESLSDFNEWVKKIRVYVWGKEIGFSQCIEELSISDVQYYKNRIVDYLGFEIYNFLKDDESVKSSIERITMIADLEEKIITDFIAENNLREKNFINSNMKFSIDEEKLSRDIIYNIAHKICDEFSIRSISFSNRIIDIDCFRYLFYIAYSFNSISEIINNKNIGFKELSLSFESYSDNKFKDPTFYNTNFKQINFSINSYGAFSHEWFHFIDHKLSEKIPFCDNNSFFSESFVPIHKKKLQEIKHDLENKFNFEQDFFNFKSVCAAENILFSLPIMLHKITNKYNLSDHFDKNMKELNIMILDISSSDFNYNKKIKLFEMWSGKFIKNLLENDFSKDFEKEIIKVINFIKENCFSIYNHPTSPCWVLMSKFEDECRGEKYYSLYSEMLARSFEIYIGYKLNNNNWGSYNSNYDLSYPKGKEFFIEYNWWEKYLPKIISILK